MSLQNDHKLDNPVWHSLNETHESFALRYGNLRCYEPDICPFGGYTGNSNISHHLNEYANLVDNFFIVGDKPEYSKSVTLKNVLVCLQMILNEKIDLNIDENIELLNTNHSRELFDLVNLVQPGYFKSKTALLGDYFGIFKNGNLVAVTGERMKLNEYSELSAIVTHPQHTGRGYAKQLIAHTANKLIGENKNPFLHVAESNTAAISLYEKLGFEVRRKISFWNFGITIK